MSTHTTLPRYSEEHQARCVRCVRIALECYDHYVIVEDWRGKILFTAAPRDGRAIVDVQAWAYPERGVMADVKLGPPVTYDFDTLERNYHLELAGAAFLPSRIGDHIQLSLNLHQLI